MPSDLQKRIEAIVQAEYDTQNISCPVCGYQWDPEARAIHITYHGEDGPKNDECQVCHTEVTITENVVRTFEVIASAGGEDDG